MTEAILSMFTGSSIIFLLVSIQSNRLNLDIKNRYKQILLPLLPIITYIVSMTIILIVSQFIVSLLGVFSFVIDAIGLVINIPLILNLAIFIVYLIIKSIVLGVLKKLPDDKFEFLDKHIKKYYEYNEDKNQWFLKKKWVNFRDLLKWVTAIGATFCGTLLGGMTGGGTGILSNSYYFPVLAVIFVGEVFAFFNCYTDDEFKDKVSGENSNSEKISNFYKIREIYEKIFPNELLVSSTSTEYSTTKGTLDLIEELAKSEDQYDRIVSDFFKNNETTDVYDTDAIEATLELLKGNNVVFYNPFYRDLGKYIILTFLNNLLAGKKCLILVGRRSVKDDIKDWLNEIIFEYGKIKSLWRVKDLSMREPECEVGVLDFSQLYDLRVIKTNKEFLQKVGFVFILEPSLVVNTGQVGLSILAKQMENRSEKPVYCIADRFVDGLVDTMSHLLQTEITEVVAPPIPKNLYTSMAWNADGDYIRQKLLGKQTQNLGNGTELAAVAIKNQLPQVTWYSETKVPVRDIKWIVGQYYHVLCKYMNLPVQQQSIYDRVKFVSSMWSAKEEEEQFVIAEDEFVNIFNTMRTFLSRGKRQTFVNVMSENYLLRDYMRFNPQMFSTNPNSIPSLVPDYAKTERNTLIKLLLTMTFRPVYEQEVINEFKLVGIESKDAFNTLTSLLKKYQYATDEIFEIETVKNSFDSKGIVTENIFSIIPEKFEVYFGESLKNAFYICEDEKSDNEYLDSKLIGHVTQTILPGQFVTYDGKYYIVKSISANTGVVLRRASNLFNGRRYYRQIRNYNIDVSNKQNIVSSRTVMDIEITQFLTDISVETSGYLDLNSNNDLRSARIIDFSKDPSADVYKRYYRNKSVLKIKLPDSDDKIRFTVCMLLSETFRTVFPNAWHYLAVTAALPENIDGMLNYMIYGINEGIDSEYIYIIEDSEIDLGLIDVIEKNLLLFMEIITDYLDWHCEKLNESDPIEVKPENQEEKKEKPFADVPKNNKKKKKNRFVEWFKRVFKRKKKNESQYNVAENASSTSVVESNSSITSETKVSSTELNYNINNVNNVNEKPNDGKNTKVPDNIEDLDIFDNTTISDEEYYTKSGTKPLNENKYQKGCYLKFGFDYIDNRIKIDEARKYLTVRGFSNNSFTKSRKREIIPYTELDFEAINHCDFCGMPLSGVSYEKLTDGRVRCNDCSSSAIKSVEELRKIFYQTKQMMENFYGIDFKNPISVQTVDARKIAKAAGQVFIPSTEYSSRTVGYAQRKGDRFSILIENGSPRLATICTMAHELTHIWQYVDWEEKERKKEFLMYYPEQEQQDALYEGMAMWVSIQYMYLIGEEAYAQQQENLTMRREDVYGYGFREFCKEYPLVKDLSLITNSPFNKFPPI